MRLTLKAARVNKGFTQKQAAKLLKIGVATLQRWENGISAPNVMQIKKLENVYGVTFEDIFFITIKTFKTHH